jgi:diguanylate cyclase (GGDEF)-like protein
MGRESKERSFRSDGTMQLDRTAIVEALTVEVEEQKQACFVILEGLDVGRIVKITDTVSVIGRDPESTVHLRDDGISRHHAEVTRTGPSSLVIRDLDSTNGTFVGGKKVPQATLREGDKVLLGQRTILKFVLQDALEESYQRKMYESSTRDGLTGAYNRKYFTEKIVTDLSFARRHGLPFTLLMLDVDLFKRVNDTYGHPTGDRVLVEVTDSISGTIRTEDTLARYGGEEFAVIAQGTGGEGGGILAERIRKKIEAISFVSVDEPRTGFRVTVSIGVCTAPPRSKAPPEQILARADKNLYEAKETGRNRVVASEIE